MGLKTATQVAFDYFTANGIPIGYRKAERVCRAWIKSQDNPTPDALQHFLSYADPTGDKATRRADKALRRTP